jgi:hypothetical protein
MTKSAPPLYVLRGILRLLKTPPLAKALAQKETHVVVVPKSHKTMNPTQTFVLQQYRNSRTGGPLLSERLERLAQDYFSLKRDLAERGRLYQLDSGAEAVLTPREMSRRAAARAGLQLPELNPDLE